MERQRMGDGAQIVKRKEKIEMRLLLFFVDVSCLAIFFSFGKTYPSGFYKDPVYYGRKSRNKSILFFWNRLKCKLLYWQSSEMA
jgi:hypothetical protein